MKIVRYLCASALLSPLLFTGVMTSAPAPANHSLKEQMLGHVERIVVIDSIAVDRADFLKAYRLRPSAGRILNGREVSAQLAGVEFPEDFSGKPSTGFTNEFNDYLIWAQPDTTGFLRLAESVRLMDGTWSTPRFTSSVLNSGEEAEDDDEEDMAADEPINANAAFPFMSDDGQTLYFAADNENSIGGLDIFVATKDPSDGRFLIPGNIGLPFNSEYDDYMMAIDPETGVGWWATDRNRLEDQVTIYVYALSDDRESVDPDDENLMTYATLSDWQSLLDLDDIPKVNALSNDIASIKVPDNRVPDFELPMPGGKTYMYYSDFKNPKAANAMMMYLNEEKSVDKIRNQLETLRKKYYLAAGDKRLGSQILSLEEELREAESNLKVLRSEIYKLEKQ